jgi:hypothetical protein
LGEQFSTLDRFIRSKQLIIALVFMASFSILFNPILGRRQRKSLELQKRIKESNKNRLGSFGGTSLDRVE